MTYHKAWTGSVTLCPIIFSWWKIIPQFWNDHIKQSMTKHTARLVREMFSTITVIYYYYLLQVLDLKYMMEQVNE